MSMHPADSPCPHHDPAITQEQAQVAWVEQSQVVMVAVDGAAGTAVGTYYLRPNSLALGAHVANAGYVVAEHGRRQGIGSRLCQHSLQEARRLGFRAMQFNLVVSTNTAVIRCWQRNGFRVVGTLPGAGLKKIRFCRLIHSPELFWLEWHQCSQSQSCLNQLERDAQSAQIEGLIRLSSVGS
jgi:L-amino acid N-acyltransferase YncA